MTIVRDHAGTSIVTVDQTLDQSEFARVSAQTDKSDTTFTDLLSIEFGVTSPRRVIASFAASYFEMVTLTGARAEFQLVVDGTPVEAVSNNLSVVNEPESCALVHRTAALAQGVHTIAIQWRRATNDGSIRVNPIDNSGITGAQLSLMAVAP